MYHAKSLSIYFVLIILCIVIVPGAAQTQEITGYTNSVDGTPYMVEISGGQMLAAYVEATDGDLDTMLTLLDPSGQRIAQNDDYDDTSTNSFLTYTVPTSGTYIVVVAAKTGTAGNFTLMYDITGEAQPAAEPTTAPVSAIGSHTGPINTGVRPENPDLIYTGYMGSDGGQDMYPIYLDAGQAAIVNAMKSSGSINTLLTLMDSAGNILAENDDRGPGEINAEIVYVAETAGEYIVMVTAHGDTYGDYRLEISFSVGGALEGYFRTPISGEAFVYDTPNFRIHYALEGPDATTMDYVQSVGIAMEHIRLTQIEQIGWPMPPTDSGVGGDDRYDVYLVDILDDFSGLLGYAAPEYPAGDNPLTPNRIEINAAASHLVLDNDYVSDILEGADPLITMRQTAAHEFNHAIQFSFDLQDHHGWFYEATAVWTEWMTFPEEQDVTRWTEYIFYYPETCLGADDYADPTFGALKYASWLFVESLVDHHGESIVVDWWDRAAIYQGWDSLREVLVTHGDSLQEAASRYHIQNLLRDYDIAAEFGDETVYIDRVVNQPGTIQVAEGAQEFGVNYFSLGLAPNTYNFQVNHNMWLWVIGVRGDTADVFRLGQRGNVDMSGYDYSYMMVLNPEYDGDLGTCTNADYTITIGAATGNAITPSFKMSAANFLPPQY